MFVICFLSMAEYYHTFRGREQFSLLNCMFNVEPLSMQWCQLISILLMHTGQYGNKGPHSSNSQTSYPPASPDENVSYLGKIYPARRICLRISQKALTRPGYGIHVTSSNICVNTPGAWRGLRSLIFSYRTPQMHACSLPAPCAHSSKRFPVRSQRESSRLWIVRVEIYTAAWWEGDVILGSAFRSPRYNF